MDVSLASPANAAYFRRRCGSHSVAVTDMGEEKGKGVVATADAPAGHTVLEDVPFAAMQHESNSIPVRHCLQCHKPLGAPPAVADCASGAAGAAGDGGYTPCPGECGEVRSTGLLSVPRALTPQPLPDWLRGAALLR